MALFSRRTPRADTPPDDVFPFWSQTMADDFRSTVRRIFAEIGSEVTVHPDHVVDSCGAQFGLTNLAATCHSEGRRRRWPRIIRQHLTSIATSMSQPDPFDHLPDAEILRSTYCRVMPTANVPDTMTYAREVAPGISQVLNLDLPTSVLYFTDEHVEKFGWRALTDAGTANLRFVDVEEHRVLERSGGRIDVLLGDSLFTASLVLVLDEVAARYGHRIDPDIGAFVAVPHRQQLDFHVPVDETALPSLQVLAGFSAAGYVDAPGQVSPDVFWWRPGAVEQVSRLTDDGIAIEIGPDLSDVLDRLTGPS